MRNRWTADLGAVGRGAEHRGCYATEPSVAYQQLRRTGPQAVAEAEAAGVRGKDVTPNLLKRILELTDGASLATNIALVKNNARLAAEIAVALAG